MAKNIRTYWYNYLDIDRILQNQSQGSTLYHVEDSASQNEVHLTQAVSRALETLQLNQTQVAAVIPINLGTTSHGVYYGSHWVGLVIRRNAAANNFEAFYNDSLGTLMENSLPNLKTILNNHGISNERITDFHTPQQTNGYDCGAWAVLNLDSLARTGDLPIATEQDVIAQRSQEFGYALHMDSAPFEVGKKRLHSKEETKEADKETDSSNEPIKIVFSGHRGYGASRIQDQREDGQFFPENSLISFKKVMNSGAESIEFDLYLSKDKHLMVVHDDNLEINTHFIVQTDTQVKKDGEFCKKGDIIPIPYGLTLVTQINAEDLKKDFDVSKGLKMPAKLLKSEEHMYQTMPELPEVLELVVVENARRAGSDLPRILVNIELKGGDTGLYVQAVIDEFNKKKAPNDQIKQEEIYYMSFSARELAAVAGIEIHDNHGNKVKAIIPNPAANLILGVPTGTQYLNVDEAVGWSFKFPPTLNRQALRNHVEQLHNDFKNLPGRQGKGLTGVDISMWDVLDESIEYFCGTLKLPLHIAVTPYGPNDLKGKYVNPALQNIEKMAIAQGKYLQGKHIMIVKTDNPRLLQEITQNLSTTQESTKDIASEERPIVIKKARIKDATGQVVMENTALKFFDKPITLRQKEAEELKKKKEEEALRQREEEAKKREEEALRKKEAEALKQREKEEASRAMEEELSKALEAPEEIDDDTTGQGSISYENASYWNEYTYSSMKTLLELRLKSTGINIDHIKIIHQNYIFNEEGSLTFIKDLVTQIGTVDTVSGTKPTLLIPINIGGKHWVGMTVEFIDGTVKVTYMDSESNAMPQSLHDRLKVELERSYSDSTVEITEQEVGYQKSNNCGLEVIENLVAAVAGMEARIEQEEVSEFHSTLYEQYLMEKALEVENALQKEKSISKDGISLNATTEASSSLLLPYSNQTTREKTLDEIWDEAQDPNVGEKELSIMDAIWNQSQTHLIETTEGATRANEIKTSIVQSLSSLANIHPNDVISAMNSMAKLLAGGSSSRCGVEINASVEPVLERLDVFNSTQNNISGIPSRNGDMSSREMLSLLEPMHITGSIGESWVE